MDSHSTHKSHRIQLGLDHEILDSQTEPEGSYPREWHEYRPNVLALGRHLVSQGHSAIQLQRYYEEPWHYGDEWVAMPRQKILQGGRVQ